MKKKIFFILLVMLLGFINILTIQNRYIANAATIGQILVVPESGWTRFDDGDKNIRYSEGFKFSLTNNGYYKGVRHEVKADISAQKIEFSFYGTKLRLFDYVYNNRTKNSKISFDGGPFEVCSAYSMTGAGPQALFYEKTGLDKKIHDVAIEIPKESAYFCLDSLDIDEDGYLIDKSKLQILYDTHKNNVQGSYTNLSWNIYKTVLDDTGIILGKTNVTPDEIDTEYNNLKVAISGLQIGPLTIGQTSTVPEDGWTRFDDNDTKIKYSDGFSTIFSKNLYKSNRHEVKADTNIYKIEFSFYGSKLRLYDYVYDNRTKNSRISFDRKPYEVCSAYSSNKSASQALFYEKTGLDKKIHDVVIEIPLEYAYFCLDFLDIDGYLIDKSELQGLYDAHKNDSQGNYADEGWNVFKESLDKAYTILVKIDSVQDEINVTVNDLKTAIKNLLYKQEVPVEKLEGIAPTKHDGSDGRITGTTSAMEYKLATSTDYTAVTGKEITDLKVGTYNIRYAAKLGFNAGAVVNVEVPDGAPDDPKLNADQGVPIEKLEGIASTKHGGSDGRITGTTSAMEYKLATSTDYIAVTGEEITDLKAGTYNIRYASKPGFNSGAVVNVEVPDGAPDEPKLNADQGVPIEKLEGIASTKHGGSDGRITGTTSAMEYKLATSTDYIAVTGEEITDLKAGTYNIRYAAKPGFNPGAVINVEVPDGAPDDPKLNADQGVPIEKLEGIAPTKHDGSDGRITGATSAMEYKLATSIDYTAVTGKEITDLKAGTYNIRYASKPGFNSGAVVNVEVPDGAPDDPKLNANQGVQTKIENESNKSNKRRNSYRKSKQLITGNGIAVQPTKNDIGLGLMLKSESMEILLTYSWRDKKLGGTVTNVLNSTHNYAGSIITAFESGRAKLSIEYSDYRNLKYIYKYEPITNSLIKVQDVLNIDGNNIELLVEKDATYYVTITPVAENMLLKEGWNTVNGFTYRIEGLNLKTGWIFENSAWYYVDEILKVRVENNWRLINNKWYAFNERGEMRTGWYYDRGAWYFLNKPNGDMGTGWRIVDGLWYYFRFNGSMASNTVIEGYKLGIDGAMINL